MSVGEILSPSHLFSIFCLHAKFKRFEQEYSGLSRHAHARHERPHTLCVVRGIHRRVVLSHAAPRAFKLLPGLNRRHDVITYVAQQGMSLME